MTDKHSFRGAITDDTRRVFDELVRPNDIYDEHGVYWADLPWKERVKFVLKMDSKETKREGSIVWAMFKADPLSPLTSYFKYMMLPGLGLGLEGYVLFSIGNIKPLFEATFKGCWGKGHTICNSTWLAAVEYLEICGIIVGQILVGILGDWLGRRWGLIQDAVIMFLGLIILTASWGVTQNGWVICYAWALFFYGIGVGGEYPMTATSGMENGVGSGNPTGKEDRSHRGRKVTSAFLMQGWGQFFNQVILIGLLLVFNHASGNPPYSKAAAQWTYRVSFAIPAVGTSWLVYYRTFRMKAAGKQWAETRNVSSVTGYDTESLKLTFTYFGPRVIATAGAWFANDVFFYGNKLFQSEFIKVISPNNPSVMEGWLYNLINVGVSLVGYYLASFLIDNKLYGRRNMQIIGFLFCFILFVVPAFNYDYYTSPAGVTAFQTMYFLSSFFNQFGPNAVTFLVAAEIYPTPVRATAHGFSAACGKLGALTAAVMYNYTSTQQKFYIVPWFGLAGMLLTVVFLPDTTGLDLIEQERRWQLLRAGRDADYHGIAVHPQHLSWWERWRGVGKHYDPNADYAQKIEEMRVDWEKKQASISNEKDRQDDESKDTMYPSDVLAYFDITRRSRSSESMPQQRRMKSG